MLVSSARPVADTTHAVAGEGGAAAAGDGAADAPAVASGTHDATSDNAPDHTTDSVLPSLDSLQGLASDYEGFLKPGVDENLRRAALKKLFGDPHFNVQDGLDIYIDDYTREDPIPEAMLKTLVQARGLLFPVETETPALPADSPAESPADSSNEVAAPGIGEPPLPAGQWASEQESIGARSSLGVETAQPPPLDGARAGSTGGKI